MDDAGALVRAQIEALNIEFWYRVDHPVSVSDVHDTYVLGDDHVWRIQHRHITAAFVGDEPAVLPFAPDEEKGAVDAV